MTTMPTWSEVAQMASHFAAERGEWGGAPVPIAGLRLTIAPRYGHESNLRGLDGVKFDDPDDTAHKPDCDDDHGITQINEWYSWRNDGTVHIYEENGQRHAFVDRRRQDTYLHRFKRLTSQIEVTTVQSGAAELKAVEKLGTLIPKHLWAMYVLQGVFLESSLRSKITYLFRKGRPTLALTPRPSGRITVLCGLCLHPLGYYEDSFCGAMVPTDEVIAHLLLMRANEHRFWRTANQHPPHAWQCGI